LSANTSDHINYLSKVSLGLLSILLICSIVYYDLRMSFIDGPFILFQIIQNDSLAIQVGRFGAAVTQVFPYLGLKAGFSLKSLMMMYSAAFTLFPLIAGIILHRVRQYVWVIALAVYYTAFCSDAFFWPNNEIHQGIPWLFLALGLYFSDLWRTKAFIKYPLAGILLVTGVFCHPLMIPLSIFLIGLFLLTDKLRLKNKTDLIFILIWLMTLWGKWYSGTQNWYDGEKLRNLSGLNPEQYLGFYETPSFKLFISGLTGTHFQVLILIIVLLVSSIISRSILVPMWSLLCIAIHLIMTVTLMTDSPLFYAQSQWMIIGLMLVFPCLMIKIRPVHKLIIQALIFIYILSFLRNGENALKKFQERKVTIDNILNAMQSKDIRAVNIRDISEETHKIFIMNWGLPVESLMLSAANGAPASFIIGPDERSDESGNYFHSCFEDIPYSRLNQYYFKGFRPVYTSISMDSLILSE
jgi:hypothetical protein